MKTSVIHGYMVMYSQWGFRAMNRQGRLEFFDPANAGNTRTMGRHNENGTTTYLFFRNKKIEVTVLDRFGRVSSDMEAPYPRLSLPAEHKKEGVA